MARVRLQQHRAARGKGGRGVATGDAEREGKVARRVHRDRPDGPQHPAEIGPGPHGPGRVGVVDGCLQERAVAEDLREESELERRALQLALQPIDTEMGLLRGERHQVVGRRVEPVARCSSQPARSEGREPTSTRAASAAAPISRSSSSGGVSPVPAFLLAHSHGCSWSRSRPTRTTGLVSVPMPGMSMVTTSPAGG